MPVLLKYAWHIKIIVQTEGTTVAQSRAGKCSNHSVGGVTARGTRNVPGVGIETTPGNSTVAKQHYIFEGIGGSGTVLAPLSFSH